MTVENQILDICEERLNLLTSPNRGYHFQFRKITRGRMTPFVVGDIPAANIYAGVDQLISKGAGFELRKLIVTIEAHGLAGERPITEVASELAADCLVSLYRSSSAPKVSDTPSPRFGGIVDGVTVLDKEFLIREGQSTPWAAARITVEVAYKVQLGQSVLWVG